MGILDEVRRGVTLVSRAIEQRRLRSALKTRLAHREPFEPGKFAIAVYFADGAVNMYQVRQWYKPLAELSKTWPVAILSRNASGMNTLLDESPVPALYVRTVADLERTVEEQDFRIVFYVNQNTRNFQMMRYGSRWHVFINHGESDKSYMTTNQYKAYDYAFVAGDAALARLDRALWDYDANKRAITIGRPQSDYFSGETPYPADDREVVLYAPTWEGDRDAASYGSVASHGVALVTALLAGGRHRVIYRPHPRTGVLDQRHAAAHRRIVAAINHANAADPNAHHVYDSGPEIGWQLAAADLAILDISAMVYDRLAVGKPLLVTRPVNESAEVDTRGYLSDCEWLDADEAATVVSRLNRLGHDDAAAARLARWVEHYFGDTTPGVATARFHAAVQSLMDEWDRHAAKQPPLAFT